MRKLFTGFAVLGIITLLSSHSEAQFGGFGGFGGGRGVLVNNKSVQEELKMTDEQKEKIAAKAKEMMETQREKMKEMFAKLKELPREEMAKKMQTMMSELQIPFSKVIDETLNDNQKLRLKQIERQQMGIAAFSNEEIAKELKITDEQKEKFKSINDEMNQEMRAIFKEMREDPTGAQKKMNSLRADAMEKAIEALTPDQKKAWKEMVGKTFEMKRDPFPFPKKKDN